MGDLYRNERHKFGDPEAERAEFLHHVEQVHAVQSQRAHDDFNGRPQRVFHMKGHAALLGTLTLRPDRPTATRHGLFADSAPQHYNVLARFSNGEGRRQHDLRPDVRGVALKIFGAPDADGSTRCVDWLMTNTPNPFGRDQQQFIEFMVADASGNLALTAFLALHPHIAALVAAASAPVASLATQRYWSGHPYLLGADRAMKFNIQPLAVPTRIAAVLSSLDHDHLRDELMQRLENGPIRYTLSVQLEVDEARTPIEDALVEWKEDDSPSIAVADLVLTRVCQTVDAETLRFTPAHHIAAHRPLGNLARGRLFTYEASQQGRAARPSDPTEADVFGA